MLRNVILALLAVVFLVPTQLTSGVPLGWDVSLAHSIPAPQLSEPATLVLLGLGMILFARSARRPTAGASERQTGWRVPVRRPFASVVAPKDRLLVDYQRRTERAGSLE